ncbi:MAG: pilus assembly protein CpaE [Chloroflexi bacterium]|nr:MAG: pilus assembly protein CpaE [Chloroflexota bacterium]
MPTSTEQKRILVISKNPTLESSINSAINGQTEFLMLESPNLAKGILPTIAELQPDVILLDFEYQARGFFDLVDKIATEYPGSAVIVILPESEMSNSERVILSGARTFIVNPFKQENLLTTVRRVMELMVRNQTGSVQPTLNVLARPKNTFTVFSPKGGAGTTTVATNLAISLNKVMREDVLLVDGKYLFGHVALCLNLRTANSLTDLITHVGMLDQRLIKQVVVRHISGVNVLPSPNSISEAQGIRPDDLFKVIQALQQVYPNIIIDGGSHLNENTVTYMDSSDKVLVVLNPDLASLRDVRQFMEISQTLSYPPGKIFFILNLTGRKADVKREEIENILKMKIFGKIPADENSALSSLNEGVPLVLKNPNHPISSAITDIAKDLAKLIKKANQDYLESHKVETSEILTKSSKLG